jgi:phenylalanyl-tRNA synthetase beta chain
MPRARSTVVTTLEQRSAGAVYPHRIFEAGEVAVSDPKAPLVSRTEQRLGALIAHETASLSEAQSYLLHLLLTHLGAGKRYELEAFQHGCFLPGRAARVTIDGQVVGVLGELHPEVLDGAKGFKVRAPCAGFEVVLGALC